MSGLRVVAPIDDLVRVAGGGSNVPYAFTLRQGTERSRLILRIRLSGSGILNDVTRELQMMRAVRDLLPVPEPYWSTDDPAWFGAAALVTEFMAGVRSAGDRRRGPAGWVPSSPPSSAGSSASSSSPTGPIFTSPSWR
jgi:aminoglycoside phosphotransferase (APT) family kinase protein